MLQCGHQGEARQLWGLPLQWVNEGLDTLGRLILGRSFAQAATRTMHAPRTFGTLLLVIWFAQRAAASSNAVRRQKAACTGLLSGNECDYYNEATGQVDGTCGADGNGGLRCTVCPGGSSVCGDPHMQGLRGQKIDWSGVDRGWYCLVKDGETNLHVNVRLTAPLPKDFPERQLVTGVSIISEGKSLILEVKNPCTIATEGCPDGVPVCLADGGLRAFVDGERVDSLLVPMRDERVTDGIEVSASNLPVECRQFGGEKLWARMYAEMLQGGRDLSNETFEQWVLRFHHMAAPGWCAKYIAERGLDDVRSVHTVFKIVTPTVDVRVNAGFGYQPSGGVTSDGRVLPYVEFWQMDVGLTGLILENDLLSGILGETARPVLDADGREIMEGYDAFRGRVEDYRVSDALGTDFALLH